MKFFHKIDVHKIDFIILEIMTILICAGLYCIYQIDLMSESKEGIFLKQCLGFGLGSVLILIILFIDYHFICKLSPLLYVAIIAILAVTFKYGNKVRDVRRWIKIAGIPFQPSELAKVILIVFLAYLCYLFRDKQKKFYPFFILAFATILPMVLILLEPHLSPCIVLLLLFCVIVLVSGISYKVILTVFLVAAPIAATLFIGVGFFHWDLPFIESYQVTRIIDFIAAEGDEDSAGKFQQNQSVAAIQSGSAYGKALTKDDQVRNYSNIYSNESDFIFSAVGEEYGFVGCCIIIFLYLILVLRCLKIAAHAPDLMGRIICTAVSALFMFQGFINVGVATNILPNTGMPFPFISYGLTSLVSSMIAIGLVLTIGQQSKR